MTTAPLHGPENIRHYILAGKDQPDFIFTIKSLASGAHLTFRARPVKRSEQDMSRTQLTAMVDLLTGPESWTFLGCFHVYQPRSGQPPMMEALTGARTQKPDGSHGSPISSDAPSAKTLHWLLGRLSRNQGPEPVAEFWHDGRCSACRRPLTDPTSVALGIGPICREKLGL